MQGYKNIADIFQLISLKRCPAGIFAWKHRMGIHLAFHQTPMNNFLHIVMPPFNSLGVLLCIYGIFIPVGDYFGGSVSLALLLLSLTFAAYLLVDVIVAVLAIAPVILLYPLCHWIYQAVDGSLFLMFIIGLVVFLAALWIQVGIGHKVYEEGIGDEDENIGEMFATLNPTYFIILPLYPIMELLFLAGYRPKTASQICGISGELRPLVEKRKREHPLGKGI
ncbi:hypothetical protein [Flexibacterium corallicola]|uniref:hypothetical protein n=1 Tax=Flexibacterium corallicola TaxID=3037259 RepID=UPI00286F2F60|nr:hypothetical protein [Pseudovibrio sp. M1P-2-3]